MPILINFDCPCEFWQLEDPKYLGDVVSSGMQADGNVTFGPPGPLGPGVVSDTGDAGLLEPTSGWASSAMASAGRNSLVSSVPQGTKACHAPE